MSRPLLSTLLRVVLILALGIGLYIECQAAPAPSVTVTMSSHPKLTAANSKKVLADVYTVAEAKAEYPDAFRAMGQLRGWSDGSVMQLALINAFYTDAVWRGALYQTVQGSPQGRLISRNKVVCDVQAAWWSNDNLYYAFGTYEFPNGGPGNAEYGSDLGGFEILHWKERWVGPTANRTATNERILFSAFHGGSDNLVDYSEGTWFTGALRVDGRAGELQSTTGPLIVGIEFWDAGEVSNTFGCMVHHCDIGIRGARGTPMNAPFTLSSFSNNIAGFEFINVANVNACMLSGDDNPEYIRSVAGYGRASTINANFSSWKMEWAVTPATLREWAPQIVTLTGKFKINVGLITYAATNAKTYTMFRLQPDVALGDSYLRVNVLDVFDNKAPDNLVVDLTNKKAWKWQFGIAGFEYSNLNGGTLKSWPVQAVEVPWTSTARSGYVPIGGQFGADGSPLWSNTTGNGSTTTPPPTTTTCTYTYSAWGTCVNGQQSRTVTASTPAGCTGTPVLTQPCTSPAPAPVLAFATTFAGSGPNLVATTGTTIAPATYTQAGTFANGTITTKAGTLYPWASGKAARVVLTGVTFTGPFAYQHITANHVIYADGRVFYRTVFSDPGKDVDTGVKLVAGTRYATLTLPCPGGVLNTVIGRPDGGNGAVMSIEALEVWQ